MGRHAGGIHVDDGSIWVPSENKLYRFSLSQLWGAAGTIIDLKPAKVLTIDSKGSFVSGMGEHLLVGEFIKERKQVPAYHQSPSGRHHAWTAVYNTNRLIHEPERNPFITSKDGTKLIRPDGVLHHRQKVQGIAMREDGWIALSISYGNTDSKIAFYRVPFDMNHPDTWPDRTSLPSGYSIPSFTLSSENHEFTLKAPAGSEELVWLRDNLLAIAFEGGAYPYRTRWDRLEDRTLILDLTQRFNP